METEDIVKERVVFSYNILGSEILENYTSTEDAIKIGKYILGAKEKIKKEYGASINILSCLGAYLTERGFRETHKFSYKITLEIKEKGDEKQLKKPLEDFLKLVPLKPTPIHGETELYNFIENYKPKK